MHNTLVTAIQKYEELHGMSDGDFALLIGIDRSLLSHLRRGRAKAGRRILVGIVQNVPELKMAVLEDLANDDGDKLPAIKEGK